MDCKKIAIMSSAYIDSELSKEEIEILNRHLEICSKCRKGLERMKNINRCLSYEEEFRLAPFFETRLFNRIQREESEELLSKDFIAMGKRVIFTGLAFSLSLAIFMTLTNKVSVYEEIQSYMFQNGSNSLSRQIAVKSEITTDDIISLVTGDE